MVCFSLSDTPALGVESFGEGSFRSFWLAFLGGMVAFPAGTVAAP